MAEDDGVGRAPERPDPAGAAARSMGQLAQQMREMAERMLSGGIPGWPVPGTLGSTGAGSGSGSGSGGGLAGTGSATPGRAPAGRRGPEPAMGARPAAGGGVPGLPAIPGMPPMPGMPGTPATMSARQLQAVVDDIAARRAQVQALVTQLTTFDEQLGALETSLTPLLQWLRTWADLEGAVTDFWTPRSPRS